MIGSGQGLLLQRQGREMGRRGREEGGERVCCEGIVSLIQQ